MLCQWRVVSWVTCAALVMSCGQGTEELGGEGLDAAPTQDMSPADAGSADVSRGAEEGSTSGPVTSGEAIACETEPVYGFDRFTRADTERGFT